MSVRLSVPELTVGLTKLNAGNVADTGLTMNAGGR